MERMKEREYCLTFQERTTMYTFLKVGFEGPLTNEILRGWNENFSPEFIEVLTEGNRELLNFFLDLKRNDIAIIVQREKNAYLATFNIMNESGRIPAPPWESVYVTKDKSLFGDPVFQIRKKLAEFGLQYEEENKYPEDHIALELEFMCYLTHYTYGALEVGKDEEYLKGLYSQYWLHKEHITRWVEPFTRDILSSDTSDFYKGLAKLLKEFVSEDYEYIKMLKEDLENG